VALDKTELSFTDPGTKSATVAVSRSGDGAVEVKSNNPLVAKGSISGTTLTVTAEGKNGAATLTVTVKEGTNYLESDEVDLVVTVDLPNIYGATWDGTSTTKWTRTDNSAEYADPVPYVAGASTYGSPFDELLPWSGMVRSKDSVAGEVVAIPKFWYSLTQTGSNLCIRIADKQVDGFVVSLAHMNRGDGKGERDVVYAGRYHCDSNYKSTTGASPKVSATRSAFRSGIHALGSTIYQSDWAMIFTEWLLYIVEFADWDSQTTIGYGCSTSSAIMTMGYTDSMPYHTGTTAADRTTYGGTQYRNIEGLWDNVYDWVDGCYYNGNGLNIILNPNNFSDTGNGTCAGTLTSGWPSAFKVTTAGGFPLFMPSASSGSATTYSCDYWGFYSSSPCLCRGGSYSQNTGHGLFFVNYSSASYSSGNIGSRLQILP
jgi:hypothetical protein